MFKQKNNEENYTMNNKFKNGEKVIVYGPGENNGKFYKNVPAKIIERDSYYLDYLVKFENSTEDWILPEHIRKTCSRKRKRRK